jgi:glutamyl-tRNA reductase
MSILVVGLSHHTASVALLEKAVAGTADRPALIKDLLAGPNVGEVVVLSTCNRVELYAAVATFHGGLHDVSTVLAGRLGVDIGDLAQSLYVHYADDAVQHLFEVVGGLESMVVGESQILGQIRSAYNAAAELGAPGRLLHELMQQALRVGKRIHTETGIGAAGASVVSEALAATAAALAGAAGANGGGANGAGLAGRRALVLGAGSMGSLAAAQLRRAGVGEIVVANRTHVSAQRLAALCRAEGTPARAVSLDGVADALAAVEVVICCTGATGAVLSVEQITESHRRVPLVVCDLGLPRNVEPGVGDVPGVILLDLSAVARRLEQRGTGSDAVSTAHSLVAQEVRHYLAAQRTAEVTPTVAALRKRAAEVVDAELLRLDGRLPGLDAAVRDELARSVRRVVDKLLHVPTVRVKQLAEAGGGEAYADALRELFELDPQAAAAIAAPIRPSSTDDPPGIR